MKGTLLPFPELEQRDVIDIRGGYVEITSQGQVARGKIIRITYWKTHTPCRIVFDEIQLWSTDKQKWIRHRERFNVQFSHSDLEEYTGPFESEDGEIFFTSSRGVYVIITPRSLEQPPLPRALKLFYDLEESIMHIAS